MASSQVSPPRNPTPSKWSCVFEALDACYRYRTVIKVGLAVVAIPLVFKLFRPAERKPYSRTAEIACLLRFLSNQEKEPRYRTGDHLSEYFLPWSWRILVRWFPWYAKRKVERTVPGGLGWVSARTRVYDEYIEHTLARERDISQVVILGAGFDTRFSRLNLPEDRLVRMFELDHPATQAHKRHIMSSVPSHLFNQPDVQSRIIYVPANFEVDTITSIMDRTTAFDPKAKTLFLCEAVTPYITSDSVDALLAFIFSHSAPGSYLAFDIRYLEAIQGTKKYHMSPLVKTVHGLGETFKFGVPEKEIATWAQEKGFNVVQHLQPPDIASLVSSSDSNSLPAPAPDIMDIIIVQTPPRK